MSNITHDDTSMDNVSDTYKLVQESKASATKEGKCNIRVGQVDSNKRLNFMTHELLH